MIKEYGYEYQAVRSEDVWRISEGKVTNQMLFGATCLRSGRDALKAIAREYEPCTALLPALSCDSMVLPFKQYGHKIAFYKLNEDYSINLDSLNINDEKVLFLYMDYFGNRAIRNEDLERLRSIGTIIFIEDRTHNLIWDRRYSFEPDYIVASLRKWIPIPDGGLLWGKITKPLSNDTTFSDLRLKAQCMRYEYLCCGDEAIKSQYREIFSSVSSIINTDEPNAMSVYSYILAKDINWNDLQTIRKENSEVLIKILATSPYVSLIQDEVGLSDLYVAFTVPKRDVIQKQLADEGIFNTIIFSSNILIRKY